ncbi:MAG TPA: putative monovalent cation/H+ antiporter subunit A [Candidatus Thermoplasmatota archaeon]|nr:putative monovalent cation/H+ antiporter subunit A [Candidatus Thermoplasmatota archaeon]
MGLELSIGVLACFAAGALAVFLPRLLGRAAAWVAALLPAFLFVDYLLVLEPLVAGASVVQTIPFLPQLDVAFSFRLDGLSLLFALLITGVGVLVLLYAGAYMDGDPRTGRLLGLLLLFMGSMLGLVLSDNAVGLFVFWELTSLTSFLLIGFHQENQHARTMALQALFVTAGGGLALLAGLVLLTVVVGSGELSVMAASGEAIRAHAWYLPALALVLAGAFTKSAQFPFHFWLPGAMTAPTPVSAYLHSATMVKAGVYLLARLHPGLGGTPAWEITVTAVGAVTMLVGAYLALRETDLKLVLAYSTVSALGTLTLLLGVGTDAAVLAAMVFLLAHALYKGSLFLVAGAVDHATGTRNIDDLSGLRRAMPFTAAAALLASLSLAGLAPFFSFIGKELLIEALVEAAPLAALALALVASAFLVAVAGIVGVRPFLGPTRPTPREPHEVSLAMWGGPLLLAVAGLLLGALPHLVEKPLTAATASAALGPVSSAHLLLWHGFTPALALSLAALAGGFVLFKGWVSLHGVHTRLERVLRYGPSRAYARGMDALPVLASRLTLIVHHGRLRGYVGVALAVAALLAALALSAAGVPRFGLSSDIRVHEVVIAFVMLSAAAVTCLSSSRLTAVVALGVVGYGTAVVFLFFGAPDLAMTQILFETLTVVLFVLILRRLPRFTQRSSRPTLRRDGAIALSIGVVVGALVLAALAAPAPEKISGYFGETSVPEGHGRNVVNVILVDFRALDTLGEITVLAVAAVGVLALLGTRRPPS